MAGQLIFTDFLRRDSAICCEQWPVLVCGGLWVCDPDIQFFTAGVDLSQ